jgi:hypothetical protein
MESALTSAVIETSVPFSWAGDLRIGAGLRDSSQRQEFRRCAMSASVENWRMRDVTLYQPLALVFSGAGSSEATRFSVFDREVDVAATHLSERRSRCHGARASRWRRNRKNYPASSAGISAYVVTAARLEANAAGTKASRSECAIGIPAAAMPIGNPDRFGPVETASTRPSRSGSVRRWRSVSNATSIGPADKPANANPHAMPIVPRSAAIGHAAKAVAAMLRRITDSSAPITRK